MPALPSAIIFINTDLTQSIQDTLTTQLFLNQIMTGADFDALVAADSNYAHQVHQNDLRILVMRSLNDFANRCLADVVLFYKDGLISIELNKLGPIAQSLQLAQLTIYKLFPACPPPPCPPFPCPPICRPGCGPGPCPPNCSTCLPEPFPPFCPPNGTPSYPPNWNFGYHNCSIPGCNHNPCIQSNVLYPLHPPERCPPLFPLGTDRFCPPNPFPPPCPPFPCPPPLPPQGAGGDLAGTYPNPTVVGIQGVPIANTPPQVNEVLLFNGTEWIPGGSGQADLPDPPAFPGNYVLDISSIGFASWMQITQDMILPGFNIISFGGSQTVEIGTTITNPAFTASYNQIPVSAMITNNASIDSPLSLSYPFTSATVTGVFTSNTSFTLSATNSASITKTAGANLSFVARSFGGVGTVGATSATASGTTAIINTSGTLANLGLFASSAGGIYGPFLSTAQCIYLLLPHTSTPYTFTDQFGFSFPMNAPITFNFTNQYSTVVSMDLYQSTNVLSSPFTLAVS